MSDLVVLRPEGLYCPAGDFHIDPWRPVERAVITHAHSDHARAGHRHYLAASPSAHVLRARLGEIRLQTLDYGAALDIGGVRVSLHPAGHVLGSAQVRLAHRGTVWVVSGDYKAAPGFAAEDATCAPFEPVRCDAFISESTFGLPVYRWQPQARIADEINAWWAGNADAGRASILYAYSFGKAQRILAMIDARIGPVYCHGATEAVNAAYRASGVALPPTLPAGAGVAADDRRRALVLAPPAAQGSAWARRFGEAADAFASGWMQLRGARRRQGVDRGFVLSDHADWPGLERAIAASGASRVILTHGQVAVMVRHLAAQGLDAQAFATEFAGEAGSAADAGAAAPGAAAGAPGAEVAAPASPAATAA
ncbi:MAG: ligase-associated DNA damage response exonuclease [Burkholderiales bacterium]|nr:ligase-associated DNA damage response exonuclease [Burkholderiales bacterium]